MDTKVDHVMSNNARLRAISRVTSPLSVAIACREDALTVRNRLRLEGSEPYQDQQNRTRCVKKNGMASSSLAVGHSNQVVSTAVSRRNARERKRVRLVNLGFATLRDHVPAGTKTKKLSKVETLRAAISYIRELQEILGERQCDDYQGSMSPTVHDDTQENYMSPQSVLLQEENSSASEEMMVELMAIAPMSNGKGANNDAVLCSSSPASSTEGSLVASYEDPPLLDIGSWFT